MKQFQRNKQYKAASPEDTVDKIKKILEECGIPVKETCQPYDDPDVVSYHLDLVEPGIATAGFAVNGKGMTKRYAHASAYAELMERLQNFLIFGDYGEIVYRLGLTKHVAAPDEVFMDAKEACKEGKEVLLPLLRMSEEEVDSILEFATDDKMSCVPYANVFEGGNIFLPHKALRMIIGSNGMAAGNTIREAMIQGISELYERAAISEAYRDNPSIPQLRLEAFKGTDIYKKLTHMHELGYSFKILDMSMGKNYPVVGLRLEKDGKAAFKAGADPCPVTALERCLTEIFQGTPDEVQGSFRSDCCPSFPDAENERIRMWVSRQALSYFVDGTGAVPDCVFHPSDTFTEAEDFASTDAESDVDDLNYLFNLTKSLGYSLYIRDWSFLGLPACQIIIPEISNYLPIYEYGEDALMWSFTAAEPRADFYTDGCARIINKLFEQYEKNIKAQDGASLQEMRLY